MLAQGLDVYTAGYQFGLGICVNDGDTGGEGADPLEYWEKNTLARKSMFYQDSGHFCRKAGGCRPLKN